MDQFKPRWGAAFGVSLLCHAVVLSGIAFFLSMPSLMPPKKNIIEVDLVDAGGGGGGGGGSEMQDGPDIKPPEATPTAPPPPPEAVPDETATNDVHEIAPEPSAAPQESYTPPFTGSSSSSSAGGSGTGSGGGHGSGVGTGTGSGTGEGSGSGSGGGSGSGYGTGTGSGTGEGSGETMGPQLLSAPKPDYPSSARSAGIEGTVGVGLVISTDGTVSSAWVIASSGNSALDQAAVNAVYSWQFVPAKQNGMPVEAQSSVPVTFRLR